MARRSHHWAILLATLLAIGACATPGFGQERSTIAPEAEAVSVVPAAEVETTNMPADSSTLRRSVERFAAGVQAGHNVDALRSMRCQQSLDLPAPAAPEDHATLATYDAVVARNTAEVTYTVTDSSDAHTESWSYEDDTWRNDTC